MFYKTAVVGAGAMGLGIAQVIAQKGVPVELVDPNGQALKTAQVKIQKSLEKLYQKKMITIEPKSALQKICFSSDIGKVKNCDLVIEAVPEDIHLKIKVFQQVAKNIAPDSIIASNTSSIPLTRLAESVAKPQRVAGLHFMNPPPLMKLVELVRAKQTAEAVFQKLLKFTRFLDKEPVVSKDGPGFIVNRLLMPMINSAIFALNESLASKEDIDKAMRLGCAHPIGPLALADLIGLDTCLSIMKIMEEGLGKEHRPCPLLKRYVKEGRLGKKTGQGFYNYSM